MEGMVSVEVDGDVEGEFSAPSLFLLLFFLFSLLPLIYVEIIYYNSASVFPVCMFLSTSSASDQHSLSTRHFLVH